MTNRIHQYLDKPSNFTRLLSIGRQMQTIEDHVFSISPVSKAARELGTTRVRVVGIIMDRTVTPSVPLYQVVRAEGKKQPGDAHCASCTDKDLE